MERLAVLLSETQTECYAWALIPNHAHFLFRSGPSGLPTLMRRLLTGYAVTFNHRHNRHGQLFQNRYKSIICQEDLYLKELVRYIHLNPLRAKLVSSFEMLRRYPCGYNFKKIADRVGAIMGVEPAYILSKGRQKQRVEARSLLCYWAVRELGLTVTEIARRIEMTPSAVGYAVVRGAKIAKQEGLKIIDAYSE